MNKLLVRILAAILSSSVLALMASAQVKYFPESPFSESQEENQYLVKHYSQELEYMHEPSLMEMAKLPIAQSYRLLVLRSWGRPAEIVRLDVNADGTSLVRTKIPHSDFRPKEPSVDSTRTPTSQETQKFLGLIKTSGFWHLPSHIHEEMVMDGNELIIEGVKEGNYHVVRRLEPGSGPIRELELAFLRDLAQMSNP
jgi:hypothetical protein